MLAYILLVCLDKNPAPMPHGKCMVVSVSSDPNTARETAVEFCRHEDKPDCADFLFVQKMRIENSIELARDLTPN